MPKGLLLYDPRLLGVDKRYMPRPVVGLRMRGPLVPPAGTGPGAPVVPPAGPGAPVVPPAGPGPAAPNVSLWDRLYGGGLQDMLSPEEQRMARAQGLLASGAAMLDASGPSIEPRSLGQIISRGLSAGREGYGQSAQTAMALREQEAKQSRQVARDALFDHMREQLGPNPTQEDLLRVFTRSLPLIQQFGDPEDVKNVLAYLKEMKPGDTFGVAGDRIYNKATGKFVDDQGTPVKTELKQDANGVWVPVDTRTGLGPDGKPVRGRTGDPEVAAERRASQERNFLNDWQSVIRPFNEQAQVVGRALALVPAAKAQNPQAQFALLGQFLKMNGIRSVSRSLIDMVTEAEGLIPGIKTKIVRTKNGVFMLPEMVDFIEHSLRAMGEQGREQAGQLTQDYGEQARRYGYNIPIRNPFDTALGVSPEEKIKQMNRDAGIP
jgi:hypothetical protein